MQQFEILNNQLDSSPFILATQLLQLKNDAQTPALKFLGYYMRNFS